MKVKKKVLGTTKDNYLMQYLTPFLLTNLHKSSTNSTTNKVNNRNYYDDNN